MAHYGSGKALIFSLTRQDLTDNRDEIITFINSRGYDLKFAMQLCVEICGECESIDELKAELQHYCRPVAETKNARILGRLEQIEIENNQ